LTSCRATWADGQEKLLVHDRWMSVSSNFTSGNDEMTTSTPMDTYMGMGQNLVPLVNIKIAGKWMFIPLKMVSIGIDS